MLSAQRISWIYTSVRLFVSWEIVQPSAAVRACGNTNVAIYSVSLKKFPWFSDIFSQTIGIFRPPVRSNGRSYKMLVMFLFFFQRVISELPRPITAKLRHMIGTCVNFINWLQKFGGPPQKIWGPKTCKISVDFIQPSILIANISGTA